MRSSVRPGSGTTKGLKWAAAMAPLADAMTGCFLYWLPRATPTACSASPAPSAARSCGGADPALLEAIVAKSLTSSGATCPIPAGARHPDTISSRPR